MPVDSCLVFYEYPNCRSILKLQKSDCCVFCLEMGYTTTTQLNRVLSGESQLSTKAFIGLIENIRVNRMFLFLGKGEIFLSEKSEIDNLQNGNRDLFIKNNEALKTIMVLSEKIKVLEKRNADLIDISSAALKYHNP